MALTMSVLACAACTGRIGDSSLSTSTDGGPRSPSDDSSDSGTVTGSPSPDGGEQPPHADSGPYGGQNEDGGQVIDGSSTPDAGPGDGGPEPLDAGTPDSGVVIMTPFTTQVTGAHCNRSRWLVLSSGDATCTEYSDMLNAEAAGVPVVVAPLPFDLADGTSLLVPATICLSAGLCEHREMRVDVDSYDDAVGITGAWSSELENGTAAGPIQPRWCDFGDDGAQQDQLASDIDMRQIALYQAVKVPVMENGAAVVSLNAPIVQGRPSRVRVLSSRGRTG